MDISHTLAPRSDQLNNDDVVASPVTVTVTEVKPGPDDQPVHIHTEEYPGRPFKPSLTARRVIAAAWGTDTTQWVGKRMTLYSDPTVTWAGQQVGGIRISHMSDLEQPMKLRLTETRNKRKEHTIQPLSEDPEFESITADQWNELLAAGNAVGLDPAQVGALAADVLQHDLRGPQDIPANQYDNILANIQQPQEGGQ